jgi:hypothetical protein
MQSVGDLSCAAAAVVAVAAAGVADRGDEESEVERAGSWPVKPRKPFRAKRRPKPERCLLPFQASEPGVPGAGGGHTPAASNIQTGTLKMAEHRGFSDSGALPSVSCMRNQLFFKLKAFKIANFNPPACICPDDPTCNFLV